MEKLNLKTIVFSCCFLMLATTFAFAQGTIQGKVISNKDGKPLASVNVFIENSTLGVTTDGKGLFTIFNVPAGVWSLKASFIGFQSGQSAIEVEQDQVISVEFVLQEDILEMNPVVVIASKKEQDLLLAPVSVGVITAREIAQKAIYSINDALTYVPGTVFIGNQVNIRNSSGFMYGAGTRILALIDGIPINASDTGEINWDLIPLIDVDHIEVIKGAGSFLYGANALGGVINIITKKPSQKGKLIIQTSAGIYDDPYHKEWRWTDRTRHFNRQDISYSKQFGKIGLQASLRRDENTGYKENGYHHRVIGSAKIHYAFNSNSNLTIYGSLMRDRRGEFIMWKDQANVLLTPNEDAATELAKINQGQFYVIFQHTHSAKLSTKIRFSLNELLLGNKFDKPDEFFPAIGPGMEWSGIWIPSKNHTITAGLEYKADKAHIIHIGKHEAYTIGPYIQHEFIPITALTVTSGFRYDYYQLDDRPAETTFSPRIGLNYLVNPDWSLRASAGKGFRPPAIIERFLNLSYAGFELLPNPELKSERAWSFELGSRFHLTNTWVGDIAVFQNDYWDLIEPTIDITSNSVQFLNIARPRIQGIELSSKLSFWNNHIGLDASATIMDHEDLTTGKYLFYRPRKILKFIPSFKWGNFDVQLEYQYMSRSDRVQVFPLDDRVPMRLWNMKMNYQWDFIRFTGGIHNLFNYNYTTRERFLEPIRNVRLGFQLEL